MPLVPFEVIPAIDVSDGKLCRLGIGGPSRVDAFGGDPGDAAEAFIEAGARWLHVVDMDQAFEGEARNLGVVRSVAALGASVQASGGMTTRRELEQALDAGAGRVVIGAAALADRSAVESLVADLGERAVVGIETEGGWVRPRGGRHDLDLGLEETLAWLPRIGAARFLHTHIRGAGAPGGPDLEGLGRIVDALGPRIIAAGGIASVEDLRAVAKLGAEGAVVGGALYDGSLSLETAIAAVR